MRAIVIPVQGPIREEQIDGLESMQAAIGGGYLEQINTPIPEIVAFCDEDGKVKGLPANMRASILMRGVIRDDDHIVGDLLLTGFDPRNGETVDLQDEFDVDLLNKALFAHSLIVVVL